ncbi:MAG: response regulator [Deltaproteobacteria bacterium]|nr:response regulator [Deltaproteobacteria bacterium]
MARILVRISPEDAAQRVSSYLLAAKYEVITGAKIDPSSDPVTMAEDILTQNPAVVILDYLPEDAWSVKLLQTVRIKNALIKFIFMVDSHLPASHVLMAMNEGASSMLTLPVTQEALNVYVTRALARRQEEKALAEELDQCHKLIEREKTTCEGLTVEKIDQKRFIREYVRLVNVLLAGTVAKGKRKILLVSDSSYQLDRFRKHLEDADFLVITALDGNKGLETARQEHPRIIVSDLEMPGMNGLEFCLAVKNDETIGPNHFIICTANQDKVSQVLKPEHKVDDCLIKPGRPEDFQEFTARVALGLLV